jgi:hypothetical protein
MGHGQNLRPKLNPIIVASRAWVNTFCIIAKVKATQNSHSGTESNSMSFVYFG